jgi:hypothetical protein
MATGQAIRLYSVKWSGTEARTVGADSNLWIIADNVEVASRKAKRFLKKDGAVGIVIKSVESHGTIDAF